MTGEELDKGECWCAEDVCWPDRVAEAMAPVAYWRLMDYLANAAMGLWARCDGESS